MYQHKVQNVDWATLAFVCDIQHFLGFPILSTFHCTLFHVNNQFYSFDLKGLTFFFGMKHYLPIFKGFFHNYFTIDSCTLFKPFVDHLL